MAKHSANKDTSNPSRGRSDANQDGSGLSVVQRLAKSRREAAEKAVFAAKLTEKPPRRR